jgi:multidrug efflux pump subunit AcrA (membrane-fusion protein)
MTKRRCRLPPSPLGRQRMSARSSITATPWACPTVRRRRRRTPWEWITSRSTRAKRTGDEAAAATNQIRISTDKVQKLGVRTEAASRRSLERIVRAVGRIEPDERRQYAIAPKFEGYVERLLVNVTGQWVGKGQPLFEVYSPELVSAQREYAIAVQGVESLNKPAVKPAAACSSWPMRASRD